MGPRCSEKLGMKKGSVTFRERIREGKKGKKKQKRGTQIGIQTGGNRVPHHV